MKILKFYATWCAPCKILSKNLVKFDHLIEEVDIEKNTELCLKHKIRSVPTLVFLKDDVEVYRHSGLISDTGFENTIKNLEKGKDAALINIENFADSIHTNLKRNNTDDKSTK